MIAADFAILLVACIAGVILDPQARGTEEIALSWQHSIVILCKKTYSQWLFASRCHCVKKNFCTLCAGGYLAPQIRPIVQSTLLVAWRQKFDGDDPSETAQLNRSKLTISTFLFCVFISIIPFTKETNYNLFFHLFSCATHASCVPNTIESLILFTIVILEALSNQLITSYI